MRRRIKTHLSKNLKKTKHQQEYLLAIKSLSLNKKFREPLIHGDSVKVNNEYYTKNELLDTITIMVTIPIDLLRIICDYAYQLRYDLYNHYYSIYYHGSSQSDNKLYRNVRFMDYLVELVG